MLEEITRGEVIYERWVEMMRIRGQNLQIVMIAGPNGAGKTTFAREYLPHEAACVDFINADLIAAGLSPFQPELAAFRAGRLMLEEIVSRVAKRKNFAFETTLSGRSYAHDIVSWQGLGYRVKLIFLSLPHAEMAIARVANRVAQGGHFVPDGVVRRRFAAGLRNFKALYQPLVDDWIHFDNSGIKPKLLEWGSRK